jgi:hypothetical protein
MPYEIHDVDLPCDETGCKNNEDDECICDEDVEELTPNDSDRCFMYSTDFHDGAQFKFGSSQEFEDFVYDHEKIAPLVVYDDRVLNLVYVDLKCPEKNPTHVHKALVQISKEDAEKVAFRPSVDGSVLVMSPTMAQFEIPDIYFKQST